MILTILRKHVLKQAFEQGKELQEEVVLLSNIFSNKLDNLVDSSDKEDIISRRQNKNVTSHQLPAIGKDRVAGDSESEERIEGTKKDMSNVSFLYRRIIKCN